MANSNGLKGLTSGGGNVHSKILPSSTEGRGTRVTSAVARGTWKLKQTEGPLPLRGEVALEEHPNLPETPPLVYLNGVSF